MSTPNIIVISDIDHVTVNGTDCGSITNVIANKNATPQEAHDALAAYVAGLQAQITAQTADANAATATSATLQGNVDNIVEKAISLNSADPAVQALVTEASALSSNSRKAKAQALVDKAAADLAAAQAALATHL